MSQTNTEVKRWEEVNKRCQVLEDVYQIQTLMARRVYFHSAGMHDREIELYSQKLDDVSFGDNNGYWIGLGTIRNTYVERFNKFRNERLRLISDRSPEIEKISENLGVGLFVIHSLTTPIIVVAEDGNTAKAMWYSPGAIAGAEIDGSFNGHWIWERYAVDFVREGGQWRFWHVLVTTDIFVRMGDKLPANTVLPTGPAAATNFEMEGPILPEIVVNQKTIWGENVVPRLFPLPPVPYASFSDTFSYGPPAG